MGKSIIEETLQVCDWYDYFHLHICHIILGDVAIEGSGKETLCLNILVYTVLQIEELFF